ncbi:MAG: flippase [Byssovorax sp.]
MIAVKNALLLGSSLIATWSVALIVRLFLPRYLGPEKFGILSFAETFAITCFIVLGMGIDLYIQKEIPVRPRHASEFFGGVVVARLLLSLGVFAFMAAVMRLSHRPAAVQRVVFVFGAAQVLIALNNSLAALLHASRKVGGLSLVNIGTKLTWAAGVGLAVAAALDIPGLAAAFLAAEVLRAALLAGLVKRHLGLTLRLDWTAVRMVLVATLPFYLNQIANTVYGKVDVSMLSVLAGDVEVGFYGAAANLASLSLLVSPLVSWVLLPLFSRAAARSRDEMYALLRRAIHAVLMLVLPVSLFTGLGADVWIPGLFGASFAPALPSLRILSPIFVFTYLAMLCAMCLLLLDRAWRVTTISLAALAGNPLLNLLLIPIGMRLWGPGGAGAAAATSLLVTESSVALALTLSVGRDAFDRRSAGALLRAAASCAAVIALDLALRSIGPIRLLVDLIAYVGLLVLLGAVRPAELLTMAQFMLRRSRHEHPTSLDEPSQITP